MNGISRPSQHLIGSRGREDVPCACALVIPAVTLVCDRFAYVYAALEAVLGAGFSPLRISWTSTIRTPLTGFSIASTSAVTICCRVTRPRRYAPLRVAGINSISHIYYHHQHASRPLLPWWRGKLLSRAAIGMYSRMNSAGGRILFIRDRVAVLLLVSLSCLTAFSQQRDLVLKQIDLPHPYYYREMYLPQLTTGPGAVAWLHDSRGVIYSMAGALWRQALNSTQAVQLT